MSFAHPFSCSFAHSLVRSLTCLLVRLQRATKAAAAACPEDVAAAAAAALLLLLLLLLLLWGIACKRAIAGAGGDGASGVMARAGKRRR